MQPAVRRASSSRGAVWTGRVISAVTALLLVFSGAIKIAKVPSVVQGFSQFGLPEHLMIPIGILEIACAVVYLVPATAVLGAILVAAYLGGATLTNVRVGESVVGPVILGLLAWLGLFLRDPRIRKLVPFRRAD